MFKGVYTAIVTPFQQDGSIDMPAYRKLVRFNLKNGVAGIVVNGTTGESPTIEHNEFRKLVKATVKLTRGKSTAIVGTGSNSTKKTIEMSVEAQELGADAVLVVNPYYNKPTQEGLYLHFKAVADSITIPVIVYNIKGRTGVNVETPTLMRLIKECRNIVAVKEASGDLNQMKAVIAGAGQGFSTLSGDDGITLDLIKAGGHGVISVVSNLVPKEVSQMVDAALNGNMQRAEQLNSQLAPLFSTAFIETNPIPIKYMLSLQGKCKEVYRLPMCALRPESKEKVKELMKTLKLV